VGQTGAIKAENAQRSTKASPAWTAQFQGQNLLVLGEIVRRETDSVEKKRSMANVIIAKIDMIGSRVRDRCRQSR